jgi:titin
MTHKRFDPYQVALVEPMENRRLLTTYTVVQPGDDATFYPGVPPQDYTLRDCIDLSNMNAGPNVIDFDITDAPPVIDLLGPVQISTPVLIDGSTQPGWQPGKPVVKLDGVVAGINDAIEVDGDHTTVRDLSIVEFPGTGVVLYGSDNAVQGNYIGVDPSGTADGNQANEVDILGANNTVGGTTAATRNLIDGIPSTDTPAVVLDGAGATKNVVEGNYIGTDVTGTKVVGNSGTGVYLMAGAANNTIGGTAAGAGNLISGNAYPTTSQNAGFATVQIDGQGTNGNVIAANLIGTDVSGKKALGNGGAGVYVDGGASGNTVGGTTAAASNVISGNGSYGVEIVTGATKTVVEGNYIGTNATGTSSLPNSGIDVLIESSANTVGGTTAATRNIIDGMSSTTNSAITLATTSATKNVIEGNYIGTDVTGKKVLGNAGTAVYLAQGSASNTIGGTVSGAGNLISGNATPSTAQSQGLAAVLIYGTGTKSNLVAANLIGTSASGTSALGNGGPGVRIGGGANGNTIGGTTAAAANVISGNQGDGIDITDATTFGNTTEGNMIGTSKDGSDNLANMGNGIAIIDAFDNSIGGTSSGASDVIGFNGEQGSAAVVGNGNPPALTAAAAAPANGVYVRGMARGNKVMGEMIGINDRNQPVPNSGYGVLIQGASNNTVGGTTAGTRNVVSANGLAGVLITGGTGGTPADGNLVQGNYIGTDLSGQPSNAD